MTLDLARVLALRGWTSAAMERLGVTIEADRVVIPVRDATGDLVGRLRYQPDPTRLNGRPKMLADADTSRELFPPPEMIGDDEVDDFLVLCEGEPDALAAWSIGLVAVGVPGAQNWDDRDAARFAGRRWTVVVCFDCDDAGRTNALRAANALVERGVDVRLVDLDPTRPHDEDDHYDLTDFLRAAATNGASRQQAVQMLAAIVEQTPPHLPAPKTDDETRAEKGERLRLTKIADVTPKRVEWEEDNLVARGMLTGLVAPGGTVKGLYGIHLAAKLAARGARTLFVCSEDALDYIVRPRFQAAGCDAELAFALSIEGEKGERTPHFPSDLPLLTQAIEEIEPRLVILDPVASYIDPGLDMGKNNEMRLILQPLITLALEAYIAILAVFHLGKSRERGAIGSVAFEDACRQVLTAARDDDDEDVRHLELTKSNIGPTGYGRMLRIVGVPLEIDGEVVEVAKLVDEGRSYKHVHSLLARKEPPGPEPEKRKLARDVLVELLVAAGTGGVNADETKQVVAEKADVSASTVWRAFNELKGEGLASGEATRDEFGSIIEWRWVAKLALLVGDEGA